MRYLFFAFSLVIAVVVIQLTGSIDLVQNVYAQSSCKIHFSCPPGKAVSAACSRKDACDGKDCVSTTSGCSISCTGDCSDGGGTGVNKGAMPGGDDGGSSGGNTGGVVSPCTQNPSSCQNGNNQPGGNKPGGNTNNPDSRCDNFPNLPGCRGHTTDNPPNNEDEPDPRRDIRGNLWYDWNQDGKSHGDEPGVANIRVEANEVNGNTKKGDKTGNGGNYAINQLPVARYVVKPVNENGWRHTTKPEDQVNLVQDGNVNNVDFGMFKGYEVPVFAYIDMNGSGGYDSLDRPFGGIYLWAQHTVFSSVDGEAATNSNGNATLSDHTNELPGLPGGGSNYYLRTYSYSPGFVRNGSNPSTFTIPNENNVLQVANQSIGFAPQWRIRGFVYRDWNENKIRDGSNEINLVGAPQIRVTGLDSWNSFINWHSGNNPSGNLRLNADGTFEATRLVPGRYDVTYTPPVNRTSTPTKYTVTVGDGWSPFANSWCSDAFVDPNTAGVTYCQTLSNSQGVPFEGNIQNLAFAVPPPPPWIRSYGLDIRFRQNFINKIGPAACDGAYASVASAITNPALSSTTNSGVLFAGNLGVVDFAPGQASPSRWVVKSTYSSPSQQLATSYDSVLAKSEAAGSINPLLGVAGCISASSCAPNNPPSGTYRVDQDLTIAGWNVSGDRSYVLLVDGNLTIDGTMQVDENGGSLVIVVSEDIIVDSGVGQALPYACGSELPTVEGIISADKDVIIESTGNCTTERAFHVEGAVIANAATPLAPPEADPGSFQNKRTLCDTNDTHPVFTVRARPDLILNSPDLLRPQKAEYRELAP